MNEKQQLRFSSFIFIKVSPEFRRLLSNEKIAAKQELESAVAFHQDEIFLRTYSLQGLRADCDMLLWLISTDVEHLQQAWAQIASAGAGKYFTEKYSYLGFFELQAEHLQCDLECGVIPAGLFGKSRYMLMHPLTRTAKWHQMTEQEQDQFLAERREVLAQFPSVTEHQFVSFGLDDQDSIVLRESNELHDLAHVTERLREKRIKNFAKADTPSFFCVGSDLRDILDRLGK